MEVASSDFAHLKHVMYSFMNWLWSGWSPRRFSVCVTSKMKRSAAAEAEWYCQEAVALHPMCQFSVMWTIGYLQNISGSSGQSSRQTLCLLTCYFTSSLHLQTRVCRYRQRTFSLPQNVPCAERRSEYFQFRGFQAVLWTLSLLSFH